MESYFQFLLMSIYGAALTRNSIDNNSLNYHEKELDEKILQAL